METVALAEQAIGQATVLFGRDHGKYPHGNALLVEGRDAAVIIDPNLGTVARHEQGWPLPRVDRVLFSHVHEDHVAGASLFPDVPWSAHEEDVTGLYSLDGILEIYGLEEPVRSNFARVIVEDFNFMARPDADAFSDGDVFDLGGVSLEVLHTPGHTRGHSCFIVRQAEGESIVYLGDIELTGFGPYYGDAWSDLESFEASLERLRHVEADHFLTFHHKGLISGRAQFLKMLEQFRAVIDRREARLLEFLDAPRTLTEIVDHRIVYRPGDTGNLVETIERRSAGMHLKRLQRDGVVTEASDRWVRA